MKLALLATKTFLPLVPDYQVLRPRLEQRLDALNDLTHTVGEDVLRVIHQPTLVIHSREDRAVPFCHAEWALQHIPQAELCEAGYTGHFFWIGPDFPRLSERMVEFLK